MRRVGTWLLAFALIGAAAPVRAADVACSVAAPCRVPTGSYLAHVPAGWDGRSPLPTMLYFHGYKGSAADEIADPQMLRFSDETGVLLVAPDGIDRSWSFPGRPEQGRDDV